MKTHFEKMYEDIGYLMYSVAAEKSKGHQATFENIQSMIEDKWKNDPGRYEVFEKLRNHMYHGIHEAITNRLSPEQAFSHFDGDFNYHSLPFGPDLREKIWLTSRYISSSIAGSYYMSGILMRLQQLLTTKANPV